jgi:uncharacterized protein YecT (DUF1311 family)
MRIAWVTVSLSMLAACGGSGEPALIASQAQPEEERSRRLHAICTAPATYARVQALAFDQAAHRRGDQGDALDRAASGARTEMVDPVSATGDPTGVVVCSGRLLLELAAAEGSEASRLSSDVEYAAQAASDGSGLVFDLEGAEPIVAELAKIGGQSIKPVPASRPVDPGAPQDGEHRARHSAGPSFDCSQARPGAEAMICSSQPLSALDRQMASLYYDGTARSGDRKRQLLRRTRDAFLARRDRCREAGCVASVYEDRIAEIRRIGGAG